MNDLIERIKQSVKEHSYHIVHGINNHDEGMTVQGFYQVIDEELVKDPQEEPNIPIQCVDGSCPIALSEEYEERGMDIVHNCEECPYQPKKEPQEYKWKDLEEKGLLIELPCNVGESVYFIKSYFSYCKEPIEEKVDRIIITNLVTFKTENRTFCLNDIGTKVFLTQSEAEQALAEMESKHERN